MIDEAAIGKTEISGLTCDSRRVAPGFLFAAIPGGSIDGRDFVDQAVERGAAAVLAPEGTVTRAAVPVIASGNPRRRYALMASRFYGRQPETVAAVTGTNGKTSVTAFVRQIWTRLGVKAASLGTLGLSAPGLEIPDGLTTPDPSDLHRSLADLHDRGVEKLAMEASSHGLAQYRLDGVKISLAGFTNLSRDHLDYHGGMDDYLEAKLRLFTELLTEDGVAVVNMDDPACDKIRRAARCRVVGYGRGGDAIRLDNLTPCEGGQRLEISVMGQPFTLTLPLSGAFQAENALCALGLVIAGGADVEPAVAALEHLQGAPGRLQHVASRDNGAAVYVDYAHTPDALANVLEALRPHASGRLDVVFGCGGDRDAGKRPEMGRIAADLADRTIVTDDNPRGEDPALIRRQVLEACPGAEDIGDRAEAIAAAVARLEAGDVLVVAGKGHETGQTVMGEVRPFDDAEQVRRAVGEAGS